MDHFKMQCIQGSSTLYLVKDAVMALAIPCIYESNILYVHLMHNFPENQEQTFGIISAPDTYSRIFIKKEKKS